MGIGKTSGSRSSGVGYTGGVSSGGVSKTSAPSVPTGISDLSLKKMLEALDVSMVNTVSTILNSEDSDLGQALQNASPEEVKELIQVVAESLENQSMDVIPELIKKIRTVA